MKRSHAKKTIYIWKETHLYAKRRTKETYVNTKRDLHMRAIYMLTLPYRCAVITQKRPNYTKKDPSIRKETYVNMKRDLHMRAIRPTQSILYVPLQVNRFQKIILLIVQYKYFKSCSREIFSRIWSSAQDHAVLVLFLNIVGFVISAWQKSVRRKYFVPQLYQLRRGISEGPALKYFYMIHRGGQIHDYHTCMLW